MVGFPNIYVSAAPRKQRDRNVLDSKLVSCPLDLCEAIFLVLICHWSTSHPLCSIAHDTTLCCSLPYPVYQCTHSTSIPVLPIIIYSLKNTHCTSVQVYPLYHYNHCTSIPTEEYPLYQCPHIWWLQYMAHHVQLIWCANKLYFIKADKSIDLILVKIVTFL